MRVPKNVVSLLSSQLLRIDAPLRFYSHYPPYYIDPVYKKDKIDSLFESGEGQKHSRLPVKAAKNNQTCSVFHDEEISKFINFVMRKGKKDLARELVSKSFEAIKRIQIAKYHKAANPESKAKIVLNPPDIFHEAVKNCTPVLELTRVVRGGTAYQVPTPLLDKRGRFLAMNWLIQASKEKDSNVRFHDQLARELIDAASNTGKVVKKKQEMHKQCEANRAYAHYRWP